eukprot:m.41141 g.41141  ORF g.41141 m.41141 type:complete len:452 (-) comp6087_c0_seq1:303-1658(-)
MQVETTPVSSAGTRASMERRSTIREPGRRSSAVLPGILTKAHFSDEKDHRFRKAVRIYTSKVPSIPSFRDKAPAPLPPQGAPHRKSKRRSSMVTVPSDEYMSNIARRYGVSTHDLEHHVWGTSNRRHSHHHGKGPRRGTKAHPLAPVPNQRTSHPTAKDRHPSQSTDHNVDEQHTLSQSQPQPRTVLPAIASSSRQQHGSPSLSERSPPSNSSPVAEIIDSGVARAAEVPHHNGMPSTPSRDWSDASSRTPSHNATSPPPHPHSRTVQHPRGASARGTSSSAKTTSSSRTHSAASTASTTPPHMRKLYRRKSIVNAANILQGDVLPPPTSSSQPPSSSATDSGAGPTLPPQQTHKTPVSDLADMLPSRTSEKHTHNTDTPVKPPSHSSTTPNAQTSAAAGDSNRQDATRPEATPTAPQHTNPFQPPSDTADADKPRKRLFSQGILVPPPSL